jgi:hypothetical protein
MPAHCCYLCVMCCPFEIHLTEHSQGFYKNVCANKCYCLLLKNDIYYKLQKTLIYSDKSN